MTRRVEDWLTGRKQIGFDWGDVVTSVVQGSCQFVIFINDIVLKVDTFRFIIKFADNKKTGRVVYNQEDRATDAQQPGDRKPGPESLDRQQPEA